MLLLLLSVLLLQLLLNDLGHGIKERERKMVTWSFPMAGTQ